MVLCAPIAYSFSRDKVPEEVYFLQGFLMVQEKYEDSFRIFYNL